MSTLPTTPRATRRRRLNAGHADQLATTLRPTLGYLGRLLRRLEAIGFTPGEHLYDLTAAAHNTLHSLTVALHSDSCDPHQTDPEADWRI